MPTPSTWVKITPFGDYKDPKQNHKVSTNTKQYSLVQRACKYGRKHAGSKRINTLRMYKLY